MSQMLIFSVFLHFFSILAQTCGVFHLIFANSTVDTLFFYVVSAGWQERRRSRQ
jgi:hypothetical protein